MHHYSWHEIIPFLQQPHLRSTFWIQNRSLCLGHAASTHPKMNGGLQCQTWDGPSLWTHLVLLIHSGILLCSPNSLPKTSKANFTHGLLTSSPLVANVWHSPESFHLLSVKAGVPPMQYSVHSHPIPDLYQLSLFGKSLLSFSWWLHHVPWHTSYIRQASCNLFLLFRPWKKKSQAGQTLGI